MRQPDLLNPEALPDWLDPAMWTAWEIHRKEIKKKLTPSTIRLQLKLLEAHKADHRAMIEQSIMAGWTGLFPLKVKSKPDPKPIQRPRETYKAPDGKVSEAGYKSALECLPAHIRKRLEAKHEKPDDEAAHV